MSTVSRAILTQTATLAGVSAVTAGVWVFCGSGVWSVGAHHTEAAAWSIRCFALAMMALGQVIFALAVLPGMFARPGSGRALEHAWALAMGLTALLAAVAGGALYAAAEW